MRPALAPAPVPDLRCWRAQSDTRFGDCGLPTTLASQVLPGTPRPGPWFPDRFGEAHQHGDAPHAVTLLRARCEWPRSGNACKKYDEFPPFHGRSSCRGPRRAWGRISRFASGNCAVGHAQAAIAHVRFGSKADMEALSPNVCFTPKSGHWLSMSGCPLCAKSRHWAPQQKRRYSILVRQLLPAATCGGPPEPRSKSTGGDNHNYR